MNARRTARLAACTAALLMNAAAHAQIGRGVEIKTIPVSGHVHMLIGQGGNIGVSVGDDGVFMIDDQFAPLTGAILEAIGSLSDKPVRFVVNTHWHGDHTGGNENLGETGAIIVAHENVRERMSKDQFIEAFNRNVPASPPKALPVITFAESITFHWNGDDIRVLHVDPAHTDGDSFIHFTKANVLHLGDTFFDGMYPFIDLGSGGSVDGTIAAAERAMSMCDAQTKVIPGHGPLSDRDGLRAYRDMLVGVRDRVKDLIENGHTRDEVIAEKPAAPYDSAYGGGFMDSDRFVGIVYDSVTAPPAAHDHP